MNLLVTGGYGFIGWQFIQLAMQNPRIKNIINVDKLTYAATNAPAAAHEHKVLGCSYGVFMKADISDRSIMQYIIEKHNIDAIVNFAAETHVDNSIKSNSEFLRTNVNGTMCLLECCKSIWGANSQNKFVQVSTDEVFGHLEPNAPAFNEQTCYNPRNPYSATKASADMLVEAYCNTYKLNAAITHCSNNYGPGQHVEKLIPKVIKNALEYKDIPVYGDGMQVRDWIYVQDHAAGVMQVLMGDTQPGEHFCIGASNEIRNIDLVNTICKQLDEMVPRGNATQSYADFIKFVDDRPGHDRRYAIDSTKMQTRFNWKPQFDFSSGIAKTLEHYILK